MKYVRNKDLIPEIMNYKETNIISEHLGNMIYLIAKNLSNKNNFCGYTWKSDMIGEAVLTTVKYLHNFNLEKSQNPFAYITQICSNSFKLFIKKEKKYSVVKDICYKHISKLEEQNNKFVNKAIDYTVLTKNIKATNLTEKIYK